MLLQWTVRRIIIFYHTFRVFYEEEKDSIFRHFQWEPLKTEDDIFFFIHFRPFTVFVLFAQKPTPTFTLTHHSQTTPWRKMAVEVIVKPRPMKRSFLLELSRQDQDNNSRTTSAAPTGNVSTDIHVPLFPEIVNARAGRFARHGAWCRKITSHRTWKRLSISSSRLFVQCRKRYKDTG